MVSIHDDAGLEELRGRLRIDPDRLRRLRNAFYKRHRDDDEAFRELPEDRRSDFAGAVASRVPALDPSTGGLSEWRGWFRRRQETMLRTVEWARKKESSQ